MCFMWTSTGGLVSCGGGLKTGFSCGRHIRVSQTVGRDPLLGREVLSTGSPKFSGNIYFQSFICKLDKNTVFLLPLFSKFSTELPTLKAHQNFDMW